MDYWSPIDPARCPRERRRAQRLQIVGVVAGVIVGLIVFTILREGWWVHGAMRRWLGLP